VSCSNAVTAARSAGGAGISTDPLLLLASPFATGVLLALLPLPLGQRAACCGLAAAVRACALEALAAGAGLDVRLERIQS
jgi:hypothetical protein